MSDARPFRIGLDNISPGDSTAPGAPGGMRMYVQTLATLLPAADAAVDLTLFSPDWNADLVPAHDRVSTVQVPGVPRDRNRRVLHQQLTLPGIVNRAGIDVLLATATVAPLRLRVPFVLVVQFLQFYVHPATYGRLRTAYLRWLVPASVRRARRVIVFTEFQRHELIAHAGADPTRIDVVPHGIRHHAFSTPATERERAAIEALTGGRPYVLYVSATYGYKNHLGLIDAFAELKQGRRGPLVLLLAGTEVGVTFAQIRARAAERGIADDVVIAGHLPSVAAAYQGATLFVFPSLYETFGFPVLEAMAAGAPVVAHQGGATAEICGDAATLADATQPAALAAAMAGVLDQPAAARAAQVARARMHAAAFTWERTAALTLASLERAVRR
jgi:glycosyltransferase involved in cell wall biosynthesis